MLLLLLGVISFGDTPDRFPPLTKPTFIIKVQFSLERVTLPFSSSIPNCSRERKLESDTSCISVEHSRELLVNLLLIKFNELLHVHLWNGKK